MNNADFFSCAIIKVGFCSGNSISPLSFYKIIFHHKSKPQCYQKTMTNVEIIWIQPKMKNLYALNTSKDTRKLTWALSNIAAGLLQ